MLCVIKNNIIEGILLNVVLLATLVFLIGVLSFTVYTYVANYGARIDLLHGFVDNTWHILGTKHSK